MKVIGFSSLNKTLLVYPSMETIPLEGNLRLGVGTRTCIGSWHAGVYHPCDSVQVPACGSCQEISACAMCSGTCLKDEKTCTEEHVIYMAMFRPDVLKVGVAKAGRIDQRLREQGADVAGIVEYAADGEVARRRERELQKRYGIKGTVRQSQKMRIDTKLDRASWDVAKAKIDLTDEMEYRYFKLPLWMRPLQVKNVLLGQVIGVKGRLVVFEKEETLYSFDLNNVLGAEVFPIKTSNRQLSLHSS